MFGNVFGNTVYSTSLVVAVFMLGLGTGSIVVGIWADRRYMARRGSLSPRTVSRNSLIGVIGLGIARCFRASARFRACPWYSREPNGWYVFRRQRSSSADRDCLVLLTPITMLMGGT